MAVKALRGGQKLQAVLRDLAAKVKTGAETHVGFLDGATYPDGTPVALVAAANEFGTATIPPRPFIRNMIAREQDGWGKMLGAALKVSEFDAHKALEIAGMRMAGQMQDSIRRTTEPANAPSTVAKKGFNQPLEDTGHMLNSVGSEVVST